MWKNFLISMILSNQKQKNPQEKTEWTESTLYIVKTQYCNVAARHDLVVYPVYSCILYWIRISSESTGIIDTAGKRLFINKNHKKNISLCAQQTLTSCRNIAYRTRPGVGGTPITCLCDVWNTDVFPPITCTRIDFQRNCKKKTKRLFYTHTGVCILSY